MSILRYLQPSLRKVLFSLVPFVFSFIKLVFSYEGIYDLMSVRLLIIIGDIFLYLGYFEALISQPFAPILKPLGWWSDNFGLTELNGPLLPGSFFVAIVYSLIIYIAWSIIAYKLAQNRKEK